jgi:hypothetical protein
LSGGLIAVNCDVVKMRRQSCKLKAEISDLHPSAGALIQIFYDRADCQPLKTGSPQKQKSTHNPSEDQDAENRECPAHDRSPSHSLKMPAPE